MSISQTASLTQEAEFLRQIAGWDEGQIADFEIQAQRDAAMARVRAKERNAAKRHDALLEYLTTPATPDNPKVDVFDPLYSGKTRMINDFGETRAEEVVHYEGKVTRYDLVIMPDGTHVKRSWLAGWWPWDKCHKAEPLKNSYTIHSAADALEAQGWTVRRGKTWARAWRCGLRPIRVGNARRRWEERNGWITHGLKNSLYDDKDPEE